MKHRVLILAFFAVTMLGVASCNHNKIACPTYKDSFDDPKKPKKPDAPQPLPKKSKSTVSHSMMPGGH